MASLDASIAEHLDWRGLSCPEPIIKAAKLARSFEQQVVIEILADDEAFPLDIRSWCKSSKHTLIELQDQGDHFSALIRINPRRKTIIPSAPPRHPSAPQDQVTAPPNPAQPDDEDPVQALLIDCRGMQCPKPILVTAKQLRKHPTQSRFVVLADDEAFPLDIESWCKSASVQLRSIHELANGGYKASIERDVTTERTPASARPGSPPAAASAPPAPSTPPARAATSQSVDLRQLDDAQQAQRLAALDALGWGGQRVEILGEADLALNLASWCKRQGHQLLQLQTEQLPARAEVLLNDQPPGQQADTAGALVPTIDWPRTGAILVLHNDLEALLAAMMVANGAASQGLEVKMYFSFWGVNLLRGDRLRSKGKDDKPSFVQRIFKKLMPRGPSRQKLGKFHFGGVGTSLINSIMRRHNVMELQELVDAAASQGVRFIACTTSMKIMGLGQRDILEADHVEFGGVASFVADSTEAEFSLVF